MVIEKGRFLNTADISGEWEGNEEGVKSAFANCSGWTEFLNALKVFTEYKISYLNK